MKKKSARENKNASDLQDKALMLQLIKQQMEALDKRILLLEEKRAELEIITQALESLEKQKNKELLIPLGSGVFLQGKLLNANTVFVEVGANVVIKKDWSQAKELIKSQINELEKAQMKLREELVLMNEEAEAREMELIREYNKKKRG